MLPFWPLLLSPKTMLAAESGKPTKLLKSWSVMSLLGPALAKAIPQAHKVPARVRVLKSKQKLLPKHPLPTVPAGRLLLARLRISPPTSQLNHLETLTTMKKLITVPTTMITQATTTASATELPAWPDTVLSLSPPWLPSQTERR